MKRILLIGSLLLAAAIGASAQSLIGTWTRKGDQLTLTPDKKAKPQIDVTTENAPEFISTIFSEQLRKEVKSALKESETGTIVSLTDKEMSIKDDEGEILVYTRK